MCLRNLQKNIGSDLKIFRTPVISLMIIPSICFGQFMYEEQVYLSFSSVFHFLMHTHLVSAPFDFTSDITRFLTVSGCEMFAFYRVSQEKCARLREGVPYVKVYRYNPKHLYPKLNGYGDNGQRSLKL